MKTQQTLRIMLSAAIAGLALAATGAFSTARADVRINAANHHHTNIHLDGDDVLITANDRSEARVTPSGSLYIDGKAVNVTDPQRAMLKQYNAGIHEIEHRGLEIGKSALEMVGGMLGGLVSAALAGDDEAGIDARANAAAEPLKQQARALCKVAHAEHHLQDQIAAQIPAFQPYAVMDDDGDRDCHIDGDREV